MKDIYSKVVLRVPLQSLDTINQNINLDNALFKEGLYIAAFDLWQEVEKAILNSKKLDRKIELSLTKYWARSCMRATPFGTFAGTFIANVGTETNLLIHPRTHLDMDVRLDMNYFNLLIDSISKWSFLKPKIKYTINNSLYSVQDSYRYAEYVLSNYNRFHELTQVTKTPYLEHVLLSLQESKKNIDQLTSVLTNNFDVLEDEANTYVSKLIDAQVLVSDLEAAYTGIPPTKQLIEKLKSHNLGDNELITWLHSLDKVLSCPKPGLEYFKNIKLNLDSFLKLNGPSKNVFQVDLFVNTQQAELDSDLLKCIVEQVDDLQVFCENCESPDLNSFKEAFKNRYENREIPLTIALDADQGVGYSFSLGKGSEPHEFIQGLSTGPNSKNIVTSYNSIHEFLIKKLLTGKENNEEVLEIFQDEINSLNESKTSVKRNTDKFILGCLMKKNGVLNKDSFLFELKSLGGTNAGNLIGRFSSQSSDIESLLNEIVKHEESTNPEAIYAEVVHVPHPRLGNVVFRSNFRKYEIPFISNSGISSDHQIPINDLMISIKNEEVVLRSVSLNKQILPCLTTAHNFSQGNLTIYKFLCDLQLQKKSFYEWNWGPISSFLHLPRVIYKNIIIQPARWRINITDIKDIPSTVEHYNKYFDLWRAARKIPKLIVLSSKDNELLIDFSNLNLVEILIDELKKRKEVVVKEFLFTNENCIVRDSTNKGYCSEIIIPLKKEEIQHNSIFGDLGVPQELHKDKYTKRFFEPGSEWLNFKIYGGNKKLEEILSFTFLPQLRRLRQENFFQYFFFVRYYDSGPHLRLRFYNPDADRLLLLQKELFEIFHPFIESEILSKTQIDTYERELERYGEEAIFDTEVFFNLDSWIVLDFLEILHGNDEKYRWIFAMRSIDAYLNNFGLNLQEKYKLLVLMSSSFYNENGGFKLLQQQLNKKYRNNQRFILSHMNQDNDNDNEIEEIGLLLQKRDTEVLSIVSKLKSVMTESEFQARIPSYLHMFMNRLFISQQRKCELVVYHFLERYYNSRTAISKKKTLTEEANKLT